jgi:antitoxin FitA
MTIRNLDDRLMRTLRIQAAYNNRSMEEEAGAILRTALSVKVGSAKSLYKAIRARIEPLGGIDLTIPGREPI